MSIQIGDALSRGFDDLTSDRGIAVLAIYLVYGIASTVIAFSFAGQIFDQLLQESELTREEFVQMSGGTDFFALALDVSLPVLGLLLLVTMILGVIVRIVAMRAFASDSPEAIPMDEVTRNLGRTFVFSVLAAILAFILVMVSLLGLIVGALVAAFLLYFVQYAVAIDDAGPVQALKKSYGVVAGNPVEALVLIIVLAVLSFVVSFVAGLVPVGEPIGTLLSTLFTQVVTVFTLATLTDAYLQATGQRGAEDAGF